MKTTIVILLLLIGCIGSTMFPAQAANYQVGDQLRARMWAYSGKDDCAYPCGRVLKIEGIQTYLTIFHNNDFIISAEAMTAEEWMRHASTGRFQSEPTEWWFEVESVARVKGSQAITVRVPHMGGKIHLTIDPAGKIETVYSTLPDGSRVSLLPTEQDDWGPYVQVSNPFLGEYSEDNYSECLPLANSGNCYYQDNDPERDWVTYIHFYENLCRVRDCEIWYQTFSLNQIYFCRERTC